MKLHERVAKISTRPDLVSFIEALRSDLESNPGDWENASLPEYLAALARWIDDMDGFYRNQGLDVPTEPSWSVLGQILIAAKMYE